MIPRACLDTVALIALKRRDDLQRIDAERESIVDVVERLDAESAHAAMRTHLVSNCECRRRFDIAH
jgi:DNA-binding FadR family transcriptional regulator